MLRADQACRDLSGFGAIARWFRQFSLLNPGQYTVSISRDGFKSSNQMVQVLLGQITIANAKLDLGSGATTVEVTGQGALLRTEDANISSSFDANQIQDAPHVTYQLVPASHQFSLYSQSKRRHLWGASSESNLLLIDRPPP